jgi:hypothetical protein
MVSTTETNEQWRLQVLLSNSNAVHQSDESALSGQGGGWM